MNQTASQGDNRTGIARHEELAETMRAGVEEFGPTSSGSKAAAGKVRIDYAREAETRGLGSVPPPKGVTKKAKAALDEVIGREPTLFMDKLGERLAFERSGTRLYEALLSKLEADGGFDDGPTRDDLVDILEEEHRHFALLVDVMRGLGGDPTAVTPSADLSATAAMGVVKIITDARTTLLQGLEAILIAELTDRQGWESLVELAREAGKKELAQTFMQAEATEARHVEHVRRWVAAGQHVAPAQAAE